VTAKKKVQDRGAQIPRNAAYLIVREIPRDAAQQRYWTFCEAVNSAGTEATEYQLLLSGFFYGSGLCRQNRHF